MKRQQVSLKNVSMEPKRFLFSLFSPQRASHLEGIYVMLGMKETENKLRSLRGYHGSVLCLSFILLEINGYHSIIFDS